MRWWDDSFFLIFTVVLVIMVLAVAIVAFLKAGEPHYQLNKNEWTCTDKRLMFIPSGKTMVPIFNCIKYERNK